MKTDLPPDCERSLDYRATIETLGLLDGEEVCLFISGGAGEAASRIQARGVLRHYRYGGWAEGFALGDVARILLCEPDFVGAEMRTLDGVDLFWIGVTLTTAEFSIGNLETDEFDRFPE
jgi:hypothetical protein